MSPSALSLLLPITISLLFLPLPLTLSQPIYPPWTPPSPSDSRSPCPGLNSLANHNILPHSGRGLTIPILISALKSGLNVGADFSTVIGSAGLLSVQGNPLATSFDLEDLREHNFPIEHDASLSRADYWLDGGDNFSFNKSVWDEILSVYGSAAVTSISLGALAKYHRVTTEKKRDPKFTYTPQQFVLSYGETALYLSTMGDPVTGVAPLDYVKVFFEQERLPYAEGWTPPKKETNLLTLGNMINSLVVASGEEVPEGLLITTNTLKLAFGGYDPITGLLAHLL